ADHIGELLTKAVTQRGKASMAVSGGSTPKPLFQALAKKDLDWQNIHITLVDERWVPPDHPESNEKLVRDHLLQDKAAKALFTGLKTEHINAAASRKTTEEQLKTLPLPFDVVILGMGGDGHTASFFPNAPELPKALNPNSTNLCETITPPHAPHQRMTLTLPVLLKARHLILHITGTDKLTVLNNALTQQNAKQMPIYSVFDDGSSPSVYWCP
ncbi:MAG: 6-phosphogluconolactonase, partial [Desulfobulbaceae bacterium]|nr:6-phosphogluconolactonase [Desulfobulbaceae bacterium]